VQVFSFALLSFSYYSRTQSLATEPLTPCIAPELFAKLASEATGRRAELSWAMDGPSERPSIWRIAQVSLGNSRANFSLVPFIFFRKKEMNSTQSKLHLKSFELKTSH